MNMLYQTIDTFNQYIYAYLDMLTKHYFLILKIAHSDSNTPIF